MRMSWLGWGRVLGRLHHCLGRRDWFWGRRSRLGLVGNPMIRYAWDF
jgi:hypothetical protein